MSGVEAGRLTGGWVVVSGRCTAGTTYRGLGGCQCQVYSRDDLPGAGWLLVAGVQPGRLTGGWVGVSVRCTAGTTYRGLGGC